MFRKLIATSSTWFTVPVRLALGAVFIAHGSQKVLCSFNGPGFKTYTAGNTPLSFMRPAWIWLTFAAFAEFFGGILVLLGFLTRVGAFLIACVMITAIAGVHWPGGFFANNRGFEYPMTLLAIGLDRSHRVRHRDSGAAVLRRRHDLQRHATHGRNPLRLLLGNATDLRAHSR